MKVSAVLLDRDGVINFDSPDYILTPDQWQAIPNSLETIARLHQAGVKLALASNQSARGRGKISAQVFTAIHHKMITAIEAHGGHLDFIAYCPHKPEDNCGCRKPKAGLLLQALQALHVTPAETIMVGDSLRDVQAALTAGVRPVLVQSGYADAAAILQQARQLNPSIVAYPDLATAMHAEFPC